MLSIGSVFGLKTLFISQVDVDFLKETSDTDNSDWDVHVEQTLNRRLNEAWSSTEVQTQRNTVENRKTDSPRLHKSPSRKLLRRSPKLSPREARFSARRSPKRSPKSSVAEVQHNAKSSRKSPRKALTYGLNASANTSQNLSGRFTDSFERIMALPGGDTCLWTTSPRKYIKPCLSRSKRRRSNTSTGKRVHINVYELGVSGFYIRGNVGNSYL